MRDHLRQNRALWAVIAVLVVVTVAVRTPDAIGEALWGDEIGSAKGITAPSLRDTLVRVRNESSPPLWFLLARAEHEVGTGLASLSPAFDPLTTMAAIRLFSVLFSAALVALVVLYARRLLPLWAAALAGLLVAVGFQFVLHGKELRAYALLTLLAAAFPFVFEWAIERPERRRLAGLAAFVAVGSMTHYFFLLPLFTGLLWLWLTPHDRRTRIRTSAAVGVGLIPLLAWLPVTLYQAGRVNSYFPPFGIRRTVAVYSGFFASDAVWQGEGPGFPARVGFLGALLGGAVVLARRAEGRLCALLVVVPWLVTALVWLAGLRIFDTRNLLVVAPFAAIALAALVAAIPYRPLALAAGTGVAVLAVWAYTVDRDLGRTPYDDIAETLEEMGWTEETPLVVLGRQDRAIRIAWHLPGHRNARLSQPGPGTCERVYVVAEGVHARRWLESRPETVLEQHEFPSYGSSPETPRRRPDMAVAELDFSPGLLADADADGAFLLQVRGRRQAPCLAPISR
jgi:hypothetical protein